MRPLNEQVMVITGASSGIGRATARKAAASGARLVLAARSVEALTATLQEITGCGGQAVAVPTDVSDFAQVDALGRHAIEQFGRIDTWVNNAGVAVYAEFARTTPEEFRRVIDVNLMGEVYGTMVALTHMREAGGVIVNVASIDADRAMPLVSAYSAAKAGVRGFSEALRVELEHDGVPVHVEVIKPASIDTPLFQHAETKLGVVPKPIPPVYDPDLVADTILRAATHPGRAVYVGGAAAGVGLMEKVAPRLLDVGFNLFGWSEQRTDVPKSPDAPNNLFAPEAGSGAIRGDWDGSAFSPYTWLKLHPNVGRAALAVGVAGLAFSLARR